MIFAGIHWVSERCLAATTRPGVSTTPSKTFKSPDKFNLSSSGYDDPQLRESSQNGVSFFSRESLEKSSSNTSSPSTFLAVTSLCVDRRVTVFDPFCVATLFIVMQTSNVTPVGWNAFVVKRQDLDQ